MYLCKSKENIIRNMFFLTNAMEKAANAKKNLIVKYEEHENNVFTIAFFFQTIAIFFSKMDAFF